MPAKPRAQSTRVRSRTRGCSCGEPFLRCSPTRQNHGLRRELHRGGAHALPRADRPERDRGRAGRRTQRRRERDRRRLPERDGRDAGEVRAAHVRVRHAVPVAGHHRGQHADRGGAVQAAHAHAHQRGAHVHGAVRHVHAPVPGPVAVLHVHVGQPLQAAVAGRVVLRVVRHERGHTHHVPYRVHLAHARPGRAKVSGAAIDWSPSSRYHHGSKISRNCNRFQIFSETSHFYGKQK